MKTQINVKYQRDVMMELAKMSINKLIDELENGIVEDLIEKTYNIQNIINTAKVLDWVVNTDDSVDIDGYYDSEHEREIEEELGIEKLNKIISEKNLI